MANDPIAGHQATIQFDRRTTLSMHGLSTRHRLHIAHPDQVMCCKRQYKVEVQLLGADESVLAQTTNSHGPVKAFFKPLADHLAGHVPRMTGGAPHR